MVDTSEYAETFRLIDANNDGLISATELRQLMEALGDEVSEDATERAVEIIDSDGDGLISLDEFATYLATRSS